MIKKVMSQDGEVIELEQDLSVRTNTNVEMWLEVLSKKVQEAIRKIFNKFWIDSSNAKKGPDKEILGNQITK